MNGSPTKRLPEKGADPWKGREGQTPYGTGSNGWISRKGRGAIGGVRWGQWMAEWLAGLCCVALFTGPARGQEGVDTVVVRKSSDSSETFERKGQIVQWRGGELQLQSKDTLRKIDTADVVAVRTLWPESFDLATSQIRQRRFSQAVGPLQDALGEETREWAVAEMQATQVRLLELTGQPHAAAIEYLKIMIDDPRSRHFATIPLAWETQQIPVAMQEDARKWMATKVPAIRLLGASWLLATIDRDQATAVLEQLSRDIEPQIAHLASAQLWRSTWVSADASTLARWSEQVQRMPNEIRSGPLLMLAEAHEKNGATDQAVISLMQVPILHEADWAHVRRALDRAAEILERHERFDEAGRVRNERANSFPETTSTRRAANVSQ